jgi:hypothetical protein
LIELRFADPSYAADPLLSRHIIIAMASFGRFMQIVGLVLPLLSIFLQLQGAITLGQMLIVLVAAVSVFWIGRIVEGYARQ